MATIIETDRLILRTWCAADILPFFEMNNDPRVIELLKGPMTMADAQAFADRANRQQKERGFTLWAVEVKDGAPFIGFVGLNYTEWLAPFTDAPEIGWRLAHAHWGKGYATEAAKAALDYGFNLAKLNEIVSCTTPINKRSLRVMEKLGMHHNSKDDFNHPKLAADDPRLGHVLYRLTREQYSNNS